MFPWGRSQELMDNSMRGMQRPEASPNRHRLLQRTAEHDGPTAKRLRISSCNLEYGRQQNNMTENSLVAHLTHAVLSNESSFSDLMGTQTSNMMYPMWPETTRRVSLSSMPSANQETDGYFDGSTAGMVQLPSRRYVDQRQRFNSNHQSSHFHAHGRAPDSSHFTQVVRRAPAAASSRGPYANFHQSGPPMHSSSAYTDNRTGIPPEIADLAWMGPIQARPSPYMPSSIHGMHQPQFSNSPNSSTWIGDEFAAEAFSNAAFDSKVLMPDDLPVVLALPEDRFKLSAHQVFLRHQIEAFKATDEDITTHTRGRNKKIKIGQVGVRCRYCAHLPVAMKQKGSVYYPSALLGLYQAAQNISATHLQCGLCTQTPQAIKQHFVALLSTRAFSSGAGRPYWAQAAKKLGLVDTDEGIRFVKRSSF